MNKAYEFLKEVGTFYIATVDGEKPKVRPFGAVNVFEDKLYIVTNNTKPTFRQIKANPNIEICGVNAQGQWLRIAAKAVVDERVEAKKAMLDANPGLRNMYNENDGLVEVLYLKDATAILSSFTAAPEVWNF